MEKSEISTIKKLWTGFLCKIIPASDFSKVDLSFIEYREKLRKDKDYNKLGGYIDFILQ